MNRRDFFKIVTTTGTAAAMSGCQQASEQILPLVVPNEQLVPGVASYFATVCRECPAGCGVLAKNREGRIVKLEGNPDHPVNRGALCVRGQAALQGAYHPDRFAGPQRRDGSVWKALGWDDALKMVAAKLGELRQGNKGRAIALVSQLENGSLGALMDRWTQALGARRVTFEPFAYEAIRAANRQTYGRDAIPEYAIEEAEVLVSFGADWVETWLGNVEYPRRFVKMHGFADGRAGTYIHIEPRQSLTASSADQWIRNAPGTEALIAQALLTLVREATAGKRSVAAAGVDVNAVAEASGVSVDTLKHIAHALAHARPGLVIGGGMATTGSHALATLVAINQLNAAIGAVGKTVRFRGDSAYTRVTPYADVAALVRAMEAGQIELLLLGPGVNPAFTLPAGLKFVEAVQKVGLVVSFSHQPDETTALAQVVLPDTHWLETWGDYSPREGITGVMQPTMSPVRAARPIGDVLITLGRAALGSEEGKGPLPWPSFEVYFKSVWEPVAKDQWGAVLEQGGVWRDVPAAPVTVEPVTVPPAPAKLDGDASGLALIAYPSLRFYDGRSASRAWLQEAPDTMTQAGWDAWVEVPVERARSLGIAQGDVVKITSPYGTIELPAYLSPTLHPGAVAIPIGHRYAPYFTASLGTPGPYGPAKAYVTQPATPMNPMALLPGAPDAASGGPSFLSVRVTLSRTGARRPLAIYQATHDQQEREIAQAVPLAAAREQALRGRPAEPEALSMYPPQHYPHYRWGLAIDVDRCLGCSACVVACIAENNIPVVGKADAAYGRQLHWLRIERWAEGPADHPTNMFLPMLCVHCEVAPCEPVCPVFAAYRTEEGLNGQVYNRCVGTRYCGNNCPYHVRRFNWYNFPFPEPLNVQLNPDVTVRQLGVMEKCTMCIQRIVAGKDHARDEKRPVRDGDILTACQQTCPTQAITFGNLKDDRSTVSTLQRSPRSYGVLEEIGTRPSVRHLRKVVREHV
jgi:anaerobic selenocysteine-containing dehydrogenase/Fe-S-cluster-containing dehydrogenase component